MTTAFHLRSHMLHLGKEYPSRLPEQLRLRLLYSDQIEHLRSGQFYLHLTLLMNAPAFLLA